MKKETKTQTYVPRIEITHHTKPPKRVTPPRVKIVDAANSEVRIWATKRTTPGFYELNFEDDKGGKLFATAIKIEVAGQSPSQSKNGGFGCSKDLQPKQPL